VTVLPAYRATILPEWIDYNGHLRDAYYMVALSYAIDEVMDHLGLDAAYRERTKCTLYTLELHMHFLQEVKSTDELTVTTSILDFDRKRIHAGCEFSCPRMSEAAATAEVMLLHVHQGDKPASASFPPEVLRKLETLKLSPDVLAARGLGSRKIELKRR
jgi:acyl-CoA thioester hydrolase